VNWTTEYPTKPGTYWVRKFQNRKTFFPSLASVVVPGLDTEPELVEVYKNGGIYWVQRAESCDGDPVINVGVTEWYGPIDPPE
jgi:hypothetical protein